MSEVGDARFANTSHPAGVAARVGPSSPNSRNFELAPPQQLYRPHRDIMPSHITPEDWEMIQRLGGERLVREFAEGLLMQKKKVLDHGYLALVQAWGSDESIIEAARMSTNKGFLGWDPGTCAACEGKGVTLDRGAVPVAAASDLTFRPLETDHPDPQKTLGAAAHSRPQDREVECVACEGQGTVRGDQHLLEYLWKHQHSTPFEMAGFIVEVQLPIFVAREWQRHRTQSYNEMSGRYVPLPNLNYIPSVERLLMNSGSPNKQAGRVKGAPPLSLEDARMFRETLAATYDTQESLYQTALQRGVPKEIARVHLPVGRYTRMRASANLRNWLAFLTLREGPQAQWEIRQYAHAVADIVTELYPRSHGLYIAPYIDRLMARNDRESKSHG